MNFEFSKLFVCYLKSNKIFEEVLILLRNLNLNFLFNLNLMFYI